MKYKGLQHLGLELLSFDLDEVKSELIEILNFHSDSLRHVKLSRNKVPSDLIELICDSLTGGLVKLQSLELLHLKEAGKVNWPKVLDAVSRIAKKGERVHPIQLVISDYQTQRRREEIYTYLEKHHSHIEIVLV